ncbi:MAG: glutamate synthase large subunit [Planctomycetaceae bacterium]|jgi:glutamate synthase domain-containing protein 2/glutamate synthase domain-containing protein 1/glutamate synthase domain-containing protein 3|nr:glutamate synthase large subunit [Planctomycetaceae bacterium]
MEIRNRFAPQGMYDPMFEHDACGIGMTVDIEGRRSRKIIQDGITILGNMSHRGAAGSDPDSGDGAGLLMQIPDLFFRHRQSEWGKTLPETGKYAVGIVFLPKKGDASKMMELLVRTIEENGCSLLGVRDVPTNPMAVGATARKLCPDVKQFLIANPNLEEAAFERRLYVIRRLAEKAVQQSGFKDSGTFYIPSLSSRTLIYKGMLMAEQIDSFYPDLLEKDMESAIAVVHQRYSTNTFPNWKLAQPFRMMCHNGEINTIRGNVDRRSTTLEILNGLQPGCETVWGEDLEKILPIFDDSSASDSALFDNMFELLSLSGRSMSHSILMMIPEAWGGAYAMSRDLRGFFEYHATFMESWDGPAAIVFCDGKSVGSILDRNGLRPARYTVTKSGRVVLASESGVLDIPPEEVLHHGNVAPGKMFLVDTVQHRIIGNDEIKAKISRSRPYRRWVEANRVMLARAGTVGEIQTGQDSLFKRMLCFGYTREELNIILQPMYETGAEPIGSMGCDIPLAVLSDKPELLFDYFKQRFAQVTNPPIDPIREKLLMSLTSFVGPLGSPLIEHPGHAHRLKLMTPILTPLDLDQILAMKEPNLHAVRLDITFSKLTPEGMREAMERLYNEADEAIARGAGILVLSDRKTSKDRAAVPSLLAAGGLGRHLLQRGMRNRAGILLESAEPRQVHHFAMLIACGVDAVCPYMAAEIIAGELQRHEKQPKLTVQQAVRNYIEAIDKGLLKIFSKMGICTIRSYRTTLSCEAVGLNPRFVEEYFGPIPSRISGLGFEDVARETLLRHQEAYADRRGLLPVLPYGGDYRNRRDGQRHLWSAEAIQLMQRAVRTGDRKLYDEFASLINHQDNGHCTIRSLITFRTEAVQKTVPLEEVESAGTLVRRFIVSAMSFGALSREVHETMAVAMNRLGGMSNSGEGGEDPVRYTRRENGDDPCSAVKQVASGRFGVTINYLAHARELQIKMAQGAKPGEGGHLPGHKVNEEIARIRNSTPGVSLISPPPHHDIYSIEDIAQLIFDLKNANPEARVSVKLVSIGGVGTIAAGVSKGKSDMILISGYDGGTGASPLSSIKNAGVPWELGLSEVQQTLVINDLRSRVKVQTDGQMRTGRDVAIAALLGAEEFGFGTGVLVSMGCVLMRKCHKNTCPVGIATQDVRLRSRFSGAPEFLINYFRFVAEELREIMASLGFRTLDDMVGHTEFLRQREDITHWKAEKLDLSPLFHDPNVPSHGIHCVEKQQVERYTPLAKAILADAEKTLANKKPVEKTYKISNIDRTVGTLLAYEVTKAFGAEGLPDDTIRYTFRGTAGQSFGAFSAPGMTMILEGTANDYVGKGLSGGKLIIRVPKNSTIDAAENIIAGKTLFYGATGGEAYINGRVGERFCVRNSGATVVVEGVGDHGCEYMTGGYAVVLGSTGTNFAAGMSGGVAYVYDPQQEFDLKCNLEMVDLEPIFLQEDADRLYQMIRNHHKYTGSLRALDMLENWERTRNLFVKVIPMEYRAALGLTNPVDLQSRQTKEQQVHLA